MKENTKKFWKIAKWFFSVWAVCVICLLGVRTQAAESKVSVSMKEAQIVSVNAPADVTTALRVTWRPVENADGYIIYRRAANSTT